MTTISEISAAYGISRNHLMKIVHELGVAGYLQTVRGKHGGLRLARPAGDINVGQVVRACEENTALAECFRDGGTCRIEEVCLLRKVMADALQAFFRELDRYFLSDLLRPRAKLARVLEILPEEARVS